MPIGHPEQRERGKGHRRQRNKREAKIVPMLKKRRKRLKR